jgi:hypothetical protein
MQKIKRQALKATLLVCPPQPQIKEEPKSRGGRCVGVATTTTIFFTAPKSQLAHNAVVYQRWRNGGRRSRMGGVLPFSTRNKHVAAGSSYMFFFKKKVKKKRTASTLKFTRNRLVLSLKGQDYSLVVPPLAPSGRQDVSFLLCSRRARKQTTQGAAGKNDSTRRPAPATRQGHRGPAAAGRCSGPRV